LDTIPLRTMESQRRLRKDDSCIAVPYHEASDGSKRLAYGRIKAMFQHTLYPGGPTLHIVDCDWYETIDTSGPLTKVIPNPNFDRCRLADLSTAYPQSLAFWPVDPFSTNPCGDLYVLHHHETDLSRL
jgi:hypothetical protein